jgi:hypothetical protein
MLKWLISYNAKNCNRFSTREKYQAGRVAQVVESEALSSSPVSLPSQIYILLVNGKLRPVETIPGTGGRGNKENDGGGEFKYDVCTPSTTIKKNY